jgi:hypothetical protein
VASALLAVATASRLPLALASGNDLNHVSGAWIALADDLAHGTLYRPLASEDGYGGTRFFPAAFAAHAALVALGADPVRSGQALALVYGAAVVAGLFLLGLRAGLGRAAALTFAVLPLAGAATQLCLGAVRGDLLAVALQAFALAALWHGPTRRAIAAAGVLLALAISAKPTAAAALAAAVAWLLLRREPRRAIALAAVALGLAALLLGATELVSAGRFSAALAAGAGGGATPADVARAPLRLAALLVHDDPGALLLAVAAGAALVAAARARALPALPALWLAASAASALAVLASPGTAVNHLADLEAASAAVLGACAARAGAPARAARLGAVAASLAGVALSLSLLARDRAGSRLDDARRALAGAPPGTLLSEDPAVPILRGERPFLLDPFMLRLAAERRPGTVAPLVQRIRAGGFAAAVLLRDPFAADEDGWYARVHLGPAVVDALRERYEVAARAGRYVVLLPRGEQAGGPRPPFAWRPAPPGG